MLQGYRVCEVQNLDQGEGSTRLDREEEAPEERSLERSDSEGYFVGKERVGHNAEQ